MARLASEAKMAFYPTSVETVRKIRKMFIFEPDAQIIDPCCGEGEAVSVFKDDKDSIADVFEKSNLNNPDSILKGSSKYLYSVDVLVLIEYAICISLYDIF